MIPEWLLRAPQSSGSKIVLGSIGWEDEDEHAFLGTADNDGHTLVRVQLFSGRDTTKDLSPTRAQGYKIVCHIPDGTFRIPPKDARCYVLLPEGMEDVPGAGIIIATVSPSPTTQFAKDRVVIDYGPNTHVVIKGKSVSMQDPAFRFISVGTPRSGGAPGVQVHLPDGTGAVWQAGSFGTFCGPDCMMQMTTSAFEVWQGSGANSTFLLMKGGEFWTYGPVNKVQGAGVYLGKAPLALNTALYGASGLAAAPSPSVFISSV